jgi:hypothetical protein
LDFLDIECKCSCKLSLKVIYLCSHWFQPEISDLRKGGPQPLLYQDGSSGCKIALAGEVMFGIKGNLKCKNERRMSSADAV